MPKVKKQSAKTRSARKKDLMRQKLLDAEYKAQNRAKSSQIMSFKRQNDSTFKQIQNKMSNKITQKKMHNDLEYARERREHAASLTKHKMDEDIEYARERREHAASLTKHKMDEDLEYARQRREHAASLTKHKMDEDLEYARHRREHSASLTKHKMDEDLEYARERREHAASLTKHKMNEDLEYARQRHEHANTLIKQKININPDFAKKRNQTVSNIAREKRKVVENREGENENNRLAKEAAKKMRDEKKLEKSKKMALQRELKMNAFYKHRIEYIDNLKEKQYNKNKEYSNENTLASKRLLLFIKEIRKVPESICCCCECLHFDDYTTNLNLDNLFKKYSAALKIKTKQNSSKVSKNETIKFDSVDEFKDYTVGVDSKKICLNCKRVLEKGKIPLINPKCGIKVPEVPVEISRMTNLEELLSAPVNAFQQLVELKPFSLNPQLAIKGAVVNIIPRVSEIHNILPKAFNKSDTIQVDFKRDLRHKSSYMFQTINVSNLMSALHILVQTELYQEYNIKINPDAYKMYDANIDATQLNFIVTDTNSKDIKLDKVKCIQMEVDENESKFQTTFKKEYNEINPDHHEENLLSYVLFENSFTTNLESINEFKLFSMCAFNSVIHAFIIIYKRIEELCKCMQDKNKNIDFFNFICSIINCSSDTARCKLYIDFILSKIPKSELNISENQLLNKTKDMSHDSAMILENFLTSSNGSCTHGSYRKFALCNKGNCNGFSYNFIEQSIIVAVMNEHESLNDNITKKIIDWTSTISKGDLNCLCNNCQSPIDCSNGCKTTYDNLLIINVQRFNSNNLEVISKLDLYKDIPTEIVIGGEIYNIILFINKSENHYKTFFKDGTNYILLDDYYQSKLDPSVRERCEKIVSHEDVKEGVNPNILIYYKQNRNVEEVNSENRQNILIKNLDQSFNELHLQDYNENEISVCPKESENLKKAITDEDYVIKSINDIESLEMEPLENIDQYLEDVMLLKDIGIDDMMNNALETDIKIDMSIPKKNVKVIAPGQGLKPIPSSKIPHYDELCFPKTYGGHKMTYDRSRISYTKATRAEIKHYSRRCTRNNVVLFKAKEKIKRDLLNARTVFVRKMRGKKLTAKEVRDGNNLQQVVDKNLAYRLLPNIRTSPMYLSKRKNHALAAIRQFNIPHIFATFTIGENYSPELLQQLKFNATGEKISPLDALNMTYAEKTKLVREDPVLCAEYFNHRINKLGTYVGDSKGHGLFGNHNVFRYIKRKEAQGRGTMHSHQTWWLKDAPYLIIGEQDPQKKNG